MKILLLCEALFLLAAFCFGLGYLIRASEDRPDERANLVIGLLLFSGIGIFLALCLIGSKP